MQNDVILKIVHEGRCKLLRTTDRTTYQSIVDEIKNKWPNMSEGKFSILYSVGCINNCYLELDSDFDGMMDFCILSSEKLVDIMFEFNDARNKSIRDSNSQGTVNNVCVNFPTSYVDVAQIKESSNITSTTLIVKENSYIPSKNCSAKFLGLGSIPNFDICPDERKKSHLSDHWGDIMAVGAIFSSGAPEFRIELIKYSLKLRFQFTFIKNSLKYVHVVCSEKQTANCQWFIKAKQTPTKVGFIVWKANLSHSCVGKLLLKDKNRFGTKVIKDLILQQVKNNPSISGNKIIEDIKKDYGLDIEYYQAWRGIEAARDNIFGCYDDSYDELRWYGDAVKRTNPGTLFYLEKDDVTNHFQRLFVSFHACKEGFQTCRPMLFIDGTFMKGRAKGVLLAATAKDGDNGLFPVAFAIVSAENRDNWAWFLSKIRDNIRHDKQIIYISDRNTGLMLAFYEVWEQPAHYFCLYHLLCNLKGRYGGGWNTQHRENMADLFKQCAYAPTSSIFNEKITKFKEVGGKIAEDWLQDTPYSKWAVYHSPHIKRYGEMTSNAAESFNSWIRDARALPITYMIDSIRKQISRWFVERRQHSQSWTGLLVPSKEQAWNEMSNISASWVVSIYPNVQFEVRSKTSVTIDLEYKICTCFQWQIKGFPCAHAVAVIKKHCASISDVVEDCFFTTSYRDCYKVDLAPVPDTERFAFKGRSQSEIFLPPLLKNPPGRPKQKRITSYGEFRRVKPTICNKCGKKGRHDTLTCAHVFGTDRTNIDN